MHHELQEQQATVESIEKLTQELEAQKQALVAKSTEINNQQDEMKAMQSRLNALTTIDSAIDAAMHSKSSAEDVIKHVIEKAMRSEHMTGCEIVQTVFKTVFRVNGRSRGHGIDDFFIDLVNDDDNMRLAIEAALKKSANVKVVDHAVLAAGHGANEDELHRNFFNRVQAVMDAKALDESSKKSEGWYHHYSQVHHAFSRLHPILQSQSSYACPLFVSLRRLRSTATASEDRRLISSRSSRSRFTTPQAGRLWLRKDA